MSLFEASVIVMAPARFRHSAWIVYSDGSIELAVFPLDDLRTYRNFWRMTTSAAGAAPIELVR